MAQLGEFVSEFAGVDEIPVMGESERSAFERHRKRLRTRAIDAAGGRISNVADPVRAVEDFDVLGVERLAHESHLDMRMLLEAIVGDDSSRFLAAVLEGIQRIVK